MILKKKKKEFAATPIFRQYGKQERPVNSETLLYRFPLNTSVYNEQSRLSQPKSYIFSLKLTRLIQTKEIFFCPD